MKRDRTSRLERRRRQVASLLEPQAIASLNPVAARFIYSLRLVAAYNRAKRDPAVELAARLGSIQLAIKALQLAETLGHAWPEPIVIRRFCCGSLSHDERTIGAVLDAGWVNDRAAVEAQLVGLIPREKFERVWSDSVDFVLAEAAAPFR